MPRSLLRKRPCRKLASLRQGLFNRFFTSLLKHFNLRKGVGAFVYVAIAST